MKRAPTYFEHAEADANRRLPQRPDPRFDSDTIEFEADDHVQQVTLPEGDES